MKKSTGIKFVRPYQLAKERGVEVQTVYRWIREGKVPPDKVRKVTVTVERFEISADFEPPKK